MSSLIEKYLVMNAFAAVSLVFWLYWFVVMFYRIYQTIKQRRICIRSQTLESQVRKQNLFNLETARKKDLFLLVILALETIMTVNMGFIGPKFLDYMYNEADKTANSTFPCAINVFVEFMYVYQVVYILYIPVCILIMTQVMLIAYLNLYIAARYFKHEVTRETRLKFIYWWIFQWVLFAITSIRQLQLFSHLMVAILMVVNLLTLNYSRKKLCSAIQSKIDEIRNFEWNPAQFRNQTTNLKFYNLTMKAIIIVFLMISLGMLFLSINFILEIILTGNCYLKKVYDIDISLLSKSKTKNVYEKFEDVINSSAFITVVLIMFTQLVPSIFFILFYLVNYIYDKCTGKGHTYKLNKALLEPMLQNE